MARLFAITLVVLVLCSAAPILLNLWGMPADITLQGIAIDRQMRGTMIQAGLAFFIAQTLLAVFVWKFSGRSANPSNSSSKARKFPGGVVSLVVAAVSIVSIEVIALGLFGQESWASLYLSPASPNAISVQVQAEQFAYYFRYPGTDGKFGAMHPEKIDENEQNYFGLDRERDATAKDDIVSAEMAIPVNREINLLMHAKDVGHSFFVPELRLQQ